MNREQRVAETFVQLADTLVDDFDVIEFLDFLAARCVELLDVSASGIMLAAHDGLLLTVAASDERARLLEVFEVQADEGPCRDCYRLNAALVNVDLAGAKDRWPLFTPRATGAGFTRATALPLRLRSQVVGSLNLFHADTGRLDEAALRLAQALADAAAIGIVHQRTVRRGEIVAGQLQQALNSRIAVEQAKGVLAERLQISTDNAFGLLRDGARARNRLLSELAGDVVSGSVGADEFLQQVAPRRQTQA